MSLLSTLFAVLIFTTTLAIAQAKIITHTTTLDLYAYYTPTADATFSTFITTTTDTSAISATTATSTSSTSTATTAPSTTVFTLTDQDTTTSTPPLTLTTAYTQATGETDDADEQQLVTWVFPATATLLFYDLFIVAAFVWCWVMGHFWWWRRERTRGGAQVWEGEREGEATERARVQWVIEREMRRVGMV